MVGRAAWIKYFFCSDVNERPIRLDNYQYL